MPGFSLIAASSPLLSAALAGAGPLPPPEPAAALPAWTLNPVQDPPPPEGAADQPPDATEPDADSDATADGNTILVEGTYGPPATDPVERINAESYRITQAVDQAVIEPLAYAYRDGLPGPLRNGLGNVVKNLGEPSNALNFLLQGKVGKAFETVGRLAINSTLGLGGLIDVAGKPGIGLPYRRNGFANTAGFYGIGPGPYLYLPVTGATTVRDVIGSTLDQLLLPIAVGAPFNTYEFGGAYFVVNGLDQRLEFDAELAEIRSTDDPYGVRRDTYLARRKREIAALKGEVVAENEPESGTIDPPAADQAAPDEDAAPPIQANPDTVIITRPR